MADAVQVPPARLVMGSKNYSSWSLRPWLFLRKSGCAFTEEIIHFDLPDYQQRIAAVSPSRRVPLLIIGEFSIADAMFAPVLFRFRSYGAKLSPISRSYFEFAIADPDLRAWEQAAQLEGHPLPAVDAVGR